MTYNKKNANPEFNVRRSQLLTPFGIGALMDVNNQSVMIADSEHWATERCEKIHDIRLETEMDAAGFIEPPVKDEQDIVGKRFPKWYFSPYDRILKKIGEWREMVSEQGVKSRIDAFDKKPYDPRNKKTELVPVRIICACKNGHAQDFPWLEWPHEGMSYNEYKNHEIKLESTGQSGSISDLIVTCKTCSTKDPKKRKSRNLMGVFDEKNFQKKIEDIGIKCRGNYEWKKSESGKKCNEGLRVLLKNANNFYFPNISSSVNIPFKENKLIEMIQNCPEYSSLEDELKSVSKVDGIEKLNNNIKIKMLMEWIADKIEKKFDEVKNEISVKFFKLKTSEANGNIMDYRRPEFDVLTGQEEYDKDSERFNIQIFSPSKFTQSPYNKLIDGITLVHQLEVVSALRSYSRIETTDSELMKEKILDGEETIDEAVEVSLKRKDGYYVGMRSLGEGIFISLNPNLVKDWKKRIKNTSVYNRIIRKEAKVRFKDELSYTKCDYYLIHTLSHLLIKELSFSSGYSSSALKERIYFSDAKDEEMYGILIYTSSADSEGTLGGLAKQGVPEKFFEILDSCLEKAQWCSFDPVCIESDSQGRDSLNAAACHACSLISETSCEKMNVFLDRGVLIGSIDEPNLGFFSKSK
ncbi:DUF1998 domain-containing protein [Oceanobacillus neutriphilus]|uniref:MrfA-like Zn-binding domain-containing protein n=1 Tax=Oceanobacillus neutriphilus TaxID=531815 RepID=A0ABQ2NV30_9BACI|nr:DUF1998 domain-containing protein [Oceanobacillus neutriphilus]GGP11241.1 hypothetical protein GCM10011346_22620 [Oceanobacillus neutriphilus]